tara:strand:+ start:671 stop:823 length:153 start_codon:yes stop_codon:yes gene_type:complete
METCFEDAYEHFRIENNYSIEEMEELYLVNGILRKRLQEVAEDLFQDLCQ